VVRDFADAAKKIEMMALGRFPRWDGDTERPEVTQKDDGYRVTSSSARTMSHVAVPSKTPRLHIEVPRASSSKRASPKSPPGTASSSKRPRLGLRREAEARDEEDSEEGSSSDSGEDEDEENEDEDEENEDEDEENEDEDEENEDEDEENEDEDDERPTVAPLKKVDLHRFTFSDGTPIAPKHFPPALGQVRG
jgi:hypothetical protein